MYHVEFAIREEAKTVTLLTQGVNDICPLPQILTLQKREISPTYFNRLLVFDVKQERLSYAELSKYGNEVENTTENRRFYAKIDSQIEFVIKPRTLQRITEFFPAYTTLRLSNFWGELTCGFVALLRVYSSKQSVPDELMIKGRKGAGRIISLYDDDDEKVVFTLEEDLIPVVDDSVFAYVKSEIISALRFEDALIEVYEADETGRKKIEEKRDLENKLLGKPLSNFSYNENDNADYAHIDYESTYVRLLYLAPSLSHFIDYVKNIKPPQICECQTMLALAQKGDRRAFCRIVNMYLRNVLRMALIYADRFGFPVEETIQNGVIGLMTAIDKYDSFERDTFQSYYPLWVRQLIQRDCSLLYQHYVPAHIRDQLLAIKRIAFLQGLHLPDDYLHVDEYFILSVSNKLEVSVQDAIGLISYLAPNISFDEVLKIQECLGISPIKRFVDCSFDVSEKLHFKWLRYEIEKMLLTLKPKERQVLRLRFGFKDGKDWTLEQVGKTLNVTRERVRQIEKKALEKLRRKNSLDKLRNLLD